MLFVDNSTYVLVSRYVVYLWKIYYAYSPVVVKVVAEVMPENLGFEQIEQRSNSVQLDRGKLPCR